MAVYLLDSHILFWALRDMPELPSNTRALIKASENDSLVSPVSFYELMFKAGRGRIHKSMLSVAEASRRAGFEVLEVSENHLKEAALFN